MSTPLHIHHSNRSLDDRTAVLCALEAALEAVEPEHLLREALVVEGQSLVIAGERCDLDGFERIFVIGAGKAGAPMARGLEELLADRIDDGVVVVPEGYATQTDRIELIEASHPVPDARSEAAAKRLQSLAGQAKEGDLVICLLSGGGSALLAAPAGDIRLDELQQTNELLVESGATIDQINAVRKHCSTIKGGQLARAIAPATHRTLVLSDVVGNRLDTIASGPTVADETTFQDAWRVVERFELSDRLPSSVTSHLQQGLDGRLSETAKPGSDAFSKGRVTIIGDCATAAEAAARAADEAGVEAAIFTTTLEGEAREIARLVASIAREVRQHGRPLSAPACLIFAGETTVTVRGDGRGGRNQELALAAAIALADEPDISVASLATDGADGPTDAAGAIVDGATLPRGQKLGLDAQEHLARNDAYPFLEAAGELLVTGPTRTNVNDVVVVWIGE